MDQKITRNFSYYEYAPNSQGGNWFPCSEYQKCLIDEHAQNLQIVRDALPAKATMRITSGVRVESDTDRLRVNGYNPSTTSDHYFGYAPRIPVGSSKYNKYGPTFNFAIGAADVVPTVVSAFELFKIAVSLTSFGSCHFGQIIYEKHGSSEWVHFGNDPRMFLSPSIVRFLGRSRFMQSLDGGKTYTSVIL